MLLKEEAEAQRVLQLEVTGDSTEVQRHLSLIEKVLLNLETKLSRLESINDKLIEAYERNNAGQRRSRAISVCPGRGE